MSIFKSKRTSQHQEADVVGLETLQVISNADSFNQWMFENIKPFCNGEILEIGSGIGNISQFFLKNGFSITLSDIRDTYCRILKQNFSSFSNLKDVIKLNIIDADFDNEYKEYCAQFDTIFALNVIEHIEDDNLAISNCYKLLKPEGKIIILVPAYQALYNRFDKELEHFRRYNKASLKSLIKNNNFTVIKSQYFNSAGILGWFVSGKLQKNKTIPQGQMKLYNLLVPVFKLVDKILFNKIGLSVISIGQK